MIDYVIVLETFALPSTTTCNSNNYDCIELCFLGYTQMKNVQHGTGKIELRYPMYNRVFLHSA